MHAQQGHARPLLHHGLRRGTGRGARAAVGQGERQCRFDMRLLITVFHFSRDTAAQAALTALL